ncbi:PREDICTED: putative serine carboxypeptidase-like 23 [Ipomoea nil]|uniref:putative serine carboxypeptidase-like 23 n=1 Tax=Ipomoea nil TaxID=35883 RepID=UPI000900B9B6|nr:PREDICTED: putative serine carboxypeptidase-like 23 [Ipomoea nil]
MKLVAWVSWLLLLLLLSSSQNGIFHIRLCQGSSQAEHLLNLIMSGSTQHSAEEWPELEHATARAISSSSSSSFSANIEEAQEGSMEADKIDALPGQPTGVKFNQYSGYVTVDRKAGRSLFYYFAESPQNSSTNPLVLWLTGGPGCSSIGNGALNELGPFIVTSDGKTLFQNDYSWNKVANMLFLESPAGVGFSYSNTGSDYNTTGDKSSAKDAYTFLINWLERFPHYKNRDFYITGESYGGHFVPQLAYTILAHNNKSNRTFINLKGIAIGNPLLDLGITLKSVYEYLWTHALISDETFSVISKECDYIHSNFSATCKIFQAIALIEMGPVNVGNIYSSFCFNDVPKPQYHGSVYDPCSGGYIASYLNRDEVQKALHAINTSWMGCSPKFGLNHWKDSVITTLPIIKQLIANKMRVWIYSGDVDALVSVTSTRYAIKAMKLPVEVGWRAWHSDGAKDVGGYVEAYKGLTLVTIRGAGHSAPSFQPERAFTMISSFLQGKLPPAFS